MKTLIYYLSAIILSVGIVSCTNEDNIYLENDGIIFNQSTPNRIIIDSAYVYIGDSVYNSWLKKYNFWNKVNKNVSSRTLSPEDYNFFNQRYIVRTTEPVVYKNRASVYLGAILNVDGITDQNFEPLIISKRNPITVSANLTYNIPKNSSATIANPCRSEIDDYIKFMVRDANFARNDKFISQYKRFTYYDEIKQSFGSNINTKELFSSSSISEKHTSDKIQKSTGLFLKFFQSSFTMYMDLKPLADSPIVGKNNTEPVYVNSITYGRLGIMVLETDESYDFARNCLSKEFNRIFENKKISLTEEEQLFLDHTEFKILIVGAGSDYTVQTVKGYGAFLNLIYKDTFTEKSFGVPISCTFAYANSHKVFETEFVNYMQIEPLFVYMDSETTGDYSDGRDYNIVNHKYLNFYKNREKTKSANPYTDIVFDIKIRKTKTKYSPDYKNWPDIIPESETNIEEYKMRNIKFDSKLYIGSETHSYESNGPVPRSPLEPVWPWEAIEHSEYISLESSPFFIII